MASDMEVRLKQSLVSHKRIYRTIISHQVSFGSANYMGLWNATLESTWQSDNTTLLDNLTALSSPSSTSSLPTAVSKTDVWAWRNGLFGVGGACIACVGVVCNCIAIVVLTRYKNSESRTSAPLLLIFLEVSDTMFLVFELFLENLVYMAQGRIITREYLTVMKPIYCVLFPVPHIAWTCSSLLVVVITVERYIVVARPMSAHRICRSANVKLAAVLVLTLAFVYHIPMYLAYRCPRKWNNTTQTEDIQFQRSEFGSSYYFINVHMTWIKLCMNFLAPFLLLLTFNVLLLRVLWRSNTIPANTNQRRSSQEKRLTAMVLSMTAIFFLCELLSSVGFILTSGINSHDQCSHTCVRFTAVADTFVIFNAASNFAIYCASGRKFREIFAQIFLRRLQATFSSSISASRSSTRVKVKLEKLLSKTTDPLNGCSDLNSAPSRRQLSLIDGSSKAFLEHHGNTS